MFVLLAGDLVSMTASVIGLTPCRSPSSRHSWPVRLIGSA
jgi:hypothetical protein